MKRGELVAKLQDAIGSALTPAQGESPDDELSVVDQIALLAAAAKPIIEQGLTIAATVGGDLLDAVVKIFDDGVQVSQDGPDALNIDFSKWVPWDGTLGGTSNG